MKRCSICKAEVDEEKASILTMGGFGNPKYLCEKCAGDMDKVTESDDPDMIREGMDGILNSITKSGVDDQVVINTVKNIFADVNERIAKIQSGNYSPDEDEAWEEELLDVPEELKESEEDRKLDEEDARKAKIVDRIFNWIGIPAFVIAMVLIVIYYFL